MRFNFSGTFLLLALSGAMVVGCEVEVEDKGSLPDVDVEADAGQMPEYEIKKTQEGEMPSLDIDAEGGKLPDVDVETADVEVEMVEKTIKVPDISVEMPDDEDDEDGKEANN